MVTHLESTQLYILQTNHWHLNENCDTCYHLGGKSGLCFNSSVCKCLLNSRLLCLCVTGWQLLDVGLCACCRLPVWTVSLYVSTVQPLGPLCLCAADMRRAARVGLRCFAVQPRRLVGLDGDDVTLRRSIRLSVGRLHPLRTVGLCRRLVARLRNCLHLRLCSCCLDWWWLIDYTAKRKQARSEVTNFESLLISVA